MNIVCLDLEGVLVPEIWIAFSEASGIPELRRTTRDEPDYDKLMKFRIGILKEHGLGLKEIQETIAKIDPMPGAKEFLDELHLDVILLWSQILSLKFLGKPVFDDIYQPTKGNGNSPYKTVAEGFKNSVFFSNSTLSTDKLIDEQTKEIISFVSEMFSWYGERAFNSLLAAERFRLCGPPQEKTRRSVSNELMKKIYGELFEQAKVKKIKDVETFIFKRLETIRKKTVSSLTDKEKKVPLN